MKLLVIGGTRFLGRHLVDAALARGDTVTLFNRGKTAAPRDGVESLVGDRKGDLSALAQGRWDAVVDTCGYLPADVARSAECLRGRVGCYAFVSSVSVYASSASTNPEDSALATTADPDTSVVDEHSYGPLKALCEAAVSSVFGDDTLLLRPGLIVGPHDPTQRFTYWPARLARAAAGEAVLAPGRPGDAVQFIDARDLALFTLRCIDAGTRGIFNVASPADQWTMGALLAACAAAAGVAVNFAWVDIAELQAQGLEPWSDLPLALPATAEYADFMRTDVRRAVAAGLVTRPLADTVADTLAWFAGLPAERRAFTLAGLSPEREAAALTAPSARVDRG